MTEDEWLNATYLPKLVRHLEEQPEPSARKFRLLGVACCRRVLEWLPDYYLADVIDTAESYCDDPGESAKVSALDRKHYLEVRSRPCRFRLVEDETDEDRYEYFSTATHSLLNDSPYIRHIAEWCADAICGHDDFESNQGE